MQQMSSGGQQPNQEMMNTMYSMLQQMQLQQSSMAPSNDMSMSQISNGQPRRQNSIKDRSPHYSDGSSSHNVSLQLQNIDGGVMSDASHGSEASRGRVQTKNHKILTFQEGLPVNIPLDTAAKMSKN
jgi:hypothetical protein